MEKITQTKKLDSSGIVTRGPCVLTAFFVGMDGVNNITGFAIYNGIDNTGKEIVPSVPFRANAMGYNGATGIKIDCPDGIYVEWTTAGTAEIVIHFYPIS